MIIHSACVETFASLLAETSVDAFASLWTILLKPGLLDKPVQNSPNKEAAHRKETPLKFDKVLFSNDAGDLQAVVEEEVLKAYC